ncbi:MAG: dihydrouridine synthase [Verrucomicrobia bacterium 21-51-4]|nr:MAG: dihydrouridine synthase [Verrucomicrobia bacterium 21-51-4]
MQDVTTLAFMRVVAQYGSPDYFFTEYFRVHDHSRLEPHILSSITENPSGRPVFAQLIGDNPNELKLAAQELSHYPIAGVDLNLGCPAPKVYKKNAGGGLLRDLNYLDNLLGVLRSAIPGLFTVKMRVGFDSADSFDGLLALIAKHKVDLLSLHGRTVKDMYRAPVRYPLIAQAVQELPCPVLANGNITSAAHALEVQKSTLAHGVMIGRAAIRNPWIFRQCRELWSAKPIFRPTLGDAHGYIKKLYDATWVEGIPENSHLSRLKKFLNFIGLSVDPQGAFLHQMRRCQTFPELWNVCEVFLLKEPQTLFSDEPHEGLVARPNCEVSKDSCA